LIFLLPIGILSAVENPVGTFFSLFGFVRYSRHEPQARAEHAINFQPFSKQSSVRGFRRFRIVFPDGRRPADKSMTPPGARAIS